VLLVASSIPVTLLPASAAPSTAPFAAPATAPPQTLPTTFFALLMIPGDDLDLLPARFLLVAAAPDFLAVNFFAVFLAADRFFVVFLVAIFSPLIYCELPGI
jgi:hypothetical protein